MQALCFYSDDKRALVWFDFNTENEPGDPGIVKMNAVSVVVLGGTGFHGIGDLAAATGTMISTTNRIFPN